MLEIKPGFWWNEDGVEFRVVEKPNGRFAILNTDTYELERRTYADIEGVKRRIPETLYTRYATQEHTFGVYHHWAGQSQPPEVYYISLEYDNTEAQNLPGVYGDGEVLPWIVSDVINELNINFEPEIGETLRIVSLEVVPI